MAFTASAVWEVQTGGSDTNNGGGFDAGVAGFPTDGAATLATSSAPVFTSASYTFVAGDVGAFVYIKSGTNWTSGWYSITSVSAGAATLNAAIGAVVLGTMNGLNTVDGCATTGSPTAATWGIDYSQNAASRITFTDMVIAATTTNFTSAANPVGKNFVGNIISVTSGTGFTAQRVAVVSTSGTTATCEKTLGTAASTGGNGRLGGALASPGLGASLMVLGNTLWLRSGTYTITSATTNISGGCCVASSNSVRFEGYGTIRSDMGTRPTLIASGISTFTLVTTSLESIFRNFIVDGASLTGSRGITTNRNLTEYVHAQNCKNNGIVTGSGPTVRCSATGCSTQPAILMQGPLIACVAYSNTVTGFGWGNNSYLLNCISCNNSGASSDGFNYPAFTVSYNCVAYGNGRHGFILAGNQTNFLQNCYAEGNGGWGFSCVSNGSFGHNCAAYNNTSGGITISGTRVESNAFTSITVGSALTDAAGGDFSLNNIASAGASLRAAGIPNAFPGVSTTSYLDIGVAQHSDPAVISLSRMFAGF